MNAASCMACCVAVLALWMVHGEVPVRCKPHNEPSRNLPKLPTAFMAMIEVNLVNQNYSLQLIEYYDEERNRYALTTVSSKGNGENKHEIFSYGSNEVISIDLRSGTCRVSPLEDFQLDWFPFPLVHRKPHYSGVSQVLHFGSEFNETYMGTALVRGIRCDHWQACINANQSSYTVDHFFTSLSWNNTRQNPVQPVRSVINGTRTSTSHGTSESHQVHQIYDFFDFVTGPPHDYEFEIPSITYCPGKKNTNFVSLPTPKWFSFETETVFVENKTIRHFREFYDSELNLIRLDHLNLSRKFSESVYQTEIYDYNTGVQYTIYDTSGVKNCKMSALGRKDSWDATKVDSHHVQMKTREEIFLFPNLSQFGYDGVWELRGFEADVWSTFSSSLDGMLDIFYLRPEWKFKTDAGVEEKRVPVRWIYYRDLEEFVTNIYNFETKPQDMSVYDISACYHWYQKHEIQMRFVGPIQKDTVDEHVFAKAFRQKISETAMVALIRIADIKVWSIPPQKDSFTVTFILLDLPSPGLEGSTVKLTRVDTPSGEAMQYLKGNITRTGSFVVEFQASDGTSTSLTADPDVFLTDVAWPASVIPRRKISRKTFTKGQAAGLGIGMMVLGLITGVVISFLFRKYQVLKQFRFKRQENTPKPTA